MELLGERPAWSMSGSEALTDLDAIDAEIARLKTCRLSRVARVDETGHAEELGARNTAELLTLRHRMDPYQAHGLVRLARALPKYTAVLDALPDPGVAVPIPDGTDETHPPEVALDPERAAVIVSTLEKVPATVPVESLRVAEEQMVRVGRDMSPGELRKFAQRVRDLLDEDGPEPAEEKAYARERLTLTPDEHGVRISGYLAGDNAELAIATIHAGARPHRTIDGERDPRSAEKRRADAMSGTFRLAAAATDAGAVQNPTTAPTTPTTTGTEPATAPTTTATTRRDTDTPAHAPDPDTSARPHTDADVEAATRKDLPADADADGYSGAAGAPPQAAADSVGLAADALLETETGGSATAQAERCAADAATATVGPVVSKNWVPGFGAKATLVVTIDWQDLKNATARAIGDTVFGTGLSASTTRLLACDAKIIPVVLGSNSEPLDVGRCERLVTKGMRHALNTRDRGCVVCGAPPVQCDAHHLISWIDGGITAVSNLVLLCRIHHVDLHHGNWVVTIVDGEVQVAKPSWADPPSRRHRTTARAPAGWPLAATRAAAATCTSSTTEPGTDEPNRREASGSGGGEGSVLTATDARAATMRAIWGEDLPPEPPARLTRLLDSGFDPWGEADTGPSSPPCARR